MLVLSSPIARADALAPPSPPQDVQVTAAGGGVQVTWSAPASTGGADAVTYRVYRDGALIADALADTRFLDAAATATASSYQVTAVNDAGESVPSSPGCIHLEFPFVDPVGCALIVVAIAFWVVEHVIGPIPPSL